MMQPLRQCPHRPWLWGLCLLLHFATGSTRGDEVTVRVTVSSDGVQAVANLPPRGGIRRPSQHHRAGRIASYETHPKSLLDVEAFEGGCLEEVETEVGDPLPEYKIGYKGASSVQGEDVFELMGTEDCSGEPRNINVTVVQHVNKSDFWKSWASLHLSSMPPQGVHYVCRTTDRADRQKCLAKFDHHVPKWKPSYWMGTLCSSWLTDDQANLLKRVTAAPDNLILDVVLYMLIVSVILWSLSCCITAVHFIFLPTIDAPEKPSFVMVPTIPGQLLGHTLWMVTFTNGIVAFVTLSLKITFAELEQSLVDAILLTGFIVGMLGILLLSRTMHTSQLASAALLHGKCLVPSSWISVFDCLLVGGVGVLSAAIGMAFMYLPVFPQELAGCASGFLGIGSVLHQMIAERRQQTEARSEVSLTQLSEVLQGTEAVGAGERLLVKCLRSKNSPVTRSTCEFYAMCRQGRDPLASDVQELPADSQGGAFLLSDVRWHGKYVHQKTGSSAALLNLPITLGMFVWLLLSFTNSFFYFRTLSPKLTNFTPVVGALVPEFHPDIKDYVYIHDMELKTFSFFAVGHEDVVRRNEIVVSGESVQNTSETSSMLIDVTIFGKRLPLDLQMNLFGGKKTSRHGSYNVAFAQVRLQLVGMRITDKSTMWSRCVYLGMRRDPVVAIPSDLKSMDVELLVIPFVQSVPRSMDEWDKLRTSETKGIITFFLDLKREELQATGERDPCKNFCATQPQCEFFRQASGGCWLGLWPGGAKLTAGCEALQAGVPDVQPGSILEKLRARRNVVGRFGNAATAMVKPKWTRSGHDDAGLLVFSNISLSTQSRYVLKRLQLGFRDVGTLQRTYLNGETCFGCQLEFVRGAARPRVMFAAGPVDMNISAVRTPSGFDVRLGPYDMAATQDKFWIAVGFVQEDSAFDITLAGEHPINLSEISDYKYYNMTKGCEECGESFGTCRDLAVCGGHVSLNFFELPVYKFQPHQSSTSATVFLKAKFAELGIENTTVSIGISTHANQLPAQWAASQTCTVDFAGQYAVSLEPLLPAPVLQTALQTCVTFRIRYRDASQSVAEAVFDLPALLAFSVRLHRSTSIQVDMLRAVAQNKHLTTTNDTTRSCGDPGSRAWAKLGANWSQVGIRISHEALSAVTFWAFLPTAANDADDVPIPWSAVLARCDASEALYKQVMLEMKGCMDVGVLAEVMGYISEQEVIPLIDLTNLNTCDGAMRIDTLNPFIGAVRWNSTSLLENMLKDLPAGFVVTAGPAGKTSHHIWAYAIMHGCLECVRIIAATLLRAEAYCAGQGEHRQVCDSSVLKKADGSSWEVLDLSNFRWGIGDAAAIDKISACLDEWNKLVSWAACRLVRQ